MTSNKKKILYVLLIFIVLSLIFILYRPVKKESTVYYGTVSNYRDGGIINIDKAEAYSLATEILSSQNTYLLSDYDKDFDERDDMMSISLYNYRHRGNIFDIETYTLYYKIYDNKEHFYVVDYEGDRVYVLHKYDSPILKKMYRKASN